MGRVIVSRCVVPLLAALTVIALTVAGCGQDHAATAARSGPSTAPRSATHDPRGVAVGCSSAVAGDLAAGWRSPRQGTVIAGPIAWPYLGMLSKARPSSFASSHGLAPATKALAVVNPGRDVTVSIPAGERSDGAPVATARFWPLGVRRGSTAPAQAPRSMSSPVLDAETEPVTQRPRPR